MTNIEASISTTLPAEITDRLIKVWELVRDVQWELVSFGEGDDDNDDVRLSQAQFEQIGEFHDKLRQAANEIAEITAASDFWRDAA